MLAVLLHWMFGILNTAMRYRDCESLATHLSRDTQVATELPNKEI